MQAFWYRLLVDINRAELALARPEHVEGRAIATQSPIAAIDHSEKALR
jgi:hypothetical protein